MRGEWQEAAFPKYDILTHFENISQPLEYLISRHSFLFLCLMHRPSDNITPLPSRAPTLRHTAPNTALRWHWAYTAATATLEKLHRDPIIRIRAWIPCKRFTTTRKARFTACIRTGNANPVRLEVGYGPACRLSSGRDSTRSPSGFSLYLVEGRHHCPDLPLD